MQEARQATDKKIGLAIGKPIRGGFTALLEECRDLAKLGCSLAVLSQEGPRLAELPDETSVTIVNAPRQAVGSWMQAIRQWHRKENPGLVHFHGRQLGIYGRIALATKKSHIAYTAHGGFPPVTPVARHTEQVIQKLLRHSTSIYAMVGEGETQEWEHEYGYGSTPHILLPHLIAPEAVRAEAKKLFPLPSLSEATVLAPGAYHPQKNFAACLKALALLGDNAPSLVFLGNSSWDRGKHRASLILLARSLGITKKVHFGEEIACLPACLQRAELVLLPSSQEGRPIVGLETCALSSPVAWSDIPGHREIFAPYGKAFPPQNPEAIAAILDSPTSWPSLAPPPAHAESMHQKATAQRETSLRSLCTLAS